MSSPTQPKLSQPVTARLTGAAVFLVLTVNGGESAEISVRELCSDLSSLIRAIGFRDLESELTCIMGFGSQCWDRLFGTPRPKDLHPFRQIDGVHQAPSTPGDILFHIRSRRMDMCFELAAEIGSRLAGAAHIVDEVHGFKYFDDRDLLGFVDGTENPVNDASKAAAIVGDEDIAFAGSSYVIVQKYLHDLKRWNGTPVHDQENMVGRAKLSDIEQAESAKKPYAHNVLTNISDSSGQQLQIVRDNMPFGEVGKGEFGTYFIGYSREPARTERMLDNMFIGDPPGNYDRLLDFSEAVTGCLFFVPTVDFLNAVTPAAASADKGEDERLPSLSDNDTAQTADSGEALVSAISDGSLGIGSLRGKS